MAKEDARIPDLREPLRLIGMLADIGAPILDLTIGNPYYNPQFGRPFERAIQGAELPDEHPLVGTARIIHITRVVQEAYPRLPLIAFGYGWLRHLMPQVAAEAIATGGAAMIGQGRGAFAYPDSPRDIISTGKMAENKCCLTCSLCTQYMRDGRNTGCAVRDAAIYAKKS